MRSAHILLLAALVVVLIADAGAARADASPIAQGVRVDWRLDFASPNDDWINDIVPLADGSYLAVGYLNRRDAGSDWRAMAVDITAAGKIVFQREYGAGGGVDAFWSAHQRPDGRLAYAGFTTRVGPGGINAWSVVSAADGAIIRENAYGGAAYDRFTDLAPAVDGGYVFVGHTASQGAGGRDVLIVKTDGEGTELWRRVFGGPGDDSGLYVEPAPGGGFLVAGGADRGGQGDMFLAKIDDTGAEQWIRYLGAPGTDDVNHGLAVRPDGSIVVVGYSKSWGARQNDVLAVSVSPDGQVLRQEMIGGAGDDHAILAKADAEGRVWVIGYSRADEKSPWMAFFTRLDRDGGFEGPVYSLTGPGDVNGASIRPLADGSLLVGGYRAVEGAGQDAFVARVTPISGYTGTAGFLRRRIAVPTAKAGAG